MSLESNSTSVDEGGLPPWLEPAIDELKALVQLPNDWNSYGARPVARWAAEETLIVLLETMDSATPQPIVVPTNRGGVQLEWHTEGIDLEIEILGSGQYSVLFEDRQSGDEWEQELARPHLEPIRAALAELARRSAAALILG